MTNCELDLTEYVLNFSKAVLKLQWQANGRTYTIFNNKAKTCAFLLRLMVIPVLNRMVNY
jgi:hypothetical protein